MQKVVCALKYSILADFDGRMKKCRNLNFPPVLKNNNRIKTRMANLPKKALNFQAVVDNSHIVAKSQVHFFVINKFHVNKNTESVFDSCSASCLERALWDFFSAHCKVVMKHCMSRTQKKCLILHYYKNNVVKTCT
jgi:hypothetical protein